MKKLFYLIIIVAAGFISACKKDKKNPDNSVDVNLLKDSVYYYEKEDYLWFDAIPSYSSFNPRDYTGSSTLEALSNELTAISQLKINTATSKPYEYSPDDPGYAKYSFMDDGTTTASLNGTNGDFGFEPKYSSVTGNDLRVKYVYPGSPADLAGLKRGYQIVSINGKNITDNSDNTVNYLVKAVYYSKSIKMQIKNYDGVLSNVTLNVSDYAVNPVLAYKVIDAGNGHKVGYLVFNAFTTKAIAKPKLDAAFNSFISNNVTDVIVDLRYNGGGEAETAEYIDDLLVPTANSNTPMYTQYYNSNLVNGTAPLFYKKFGLTKDFFQPENNLRIFNKALSLSINRVFFIVTSLTASSSELTINNLRPVLNVQLVGDTTYGKPVGEHPIPLGKTNYSIFSPQIYVENSANQGDYYGGMAPGSIDYPGCLTSDDVTKDFGDVTENMLAHTLNFIQSGTYALNKPQVKSLTDASLPANLYKSKVLSRKMDQHKFKPLIFRMNK